MHLLRTLAAVGASAVVILTLYGSRQYVARTYPGVPAYYSFDGGPFTFDGDYRKGRAGLFRIGVSKAEALSHLLQDPGRQIRVITDANYIGPELYFGSQQRDSAQLGSYLLARDEWRIVIPQQGAQVVYTTRFEQGRLVQVKIFSRIA